MSSNPMDSTVLIPLLFALEPGFEDLHHGSLIRIVRPEGEHVGALHVSRPADPPRFGAVVQFGPAGVTGDSAPPATSDASFAATGHAGLPVHRLTLEELRRIERTGKPDVPFVLVVS